MRPLSLLTSIALLVAPGAALAQGKGGEGTRTRVILGPQITPASPGAKDVSFGPFIEVGRARAGEVFDFEAPDESFGFPVARFGGVAVGPALSFMGSRKVDDLGVTLPKVGSTFEAGAFVQGNVTPGLRLRAEARRGIGGHDGWIGELSADLVARDGDNWLVSAGPRITLHDARYQRAFFGVTPAGSLTSGLAAYRPDGGVSSVGIAVGALKQLGPRLGFAAYARYDRLVGDAADSPIARGPGTRNQPSAGLALSYIFGPLGRR